MKFIKFLFSKVFFLNLFLAIILLITGLFVLDKYLDGITKHGEQVIVPNIINKKISDLDDILLNRGFRYQIMDSVWERKLPKGIIVDHKPAPGDSVKEGRKIYLTINARSDEMIKLSIGSIINGTSTAREALEYISSIDIEHDSTILVPNDYDDIVIGFKDIQGNNLKDGDKLKAGSKIWLIVGHDRGEKIRTPKVLGLPLMEAVKALKKKLLNVYVMETSDGACVDGIDSSLARITLQRPACGDDIKIGKEVSIFYSCDTTLKINTDCK
jgi:beta-lactam-binding protein with PASTA domain